MRPFSPYTNFTRFYMCRSFIVGSMYLVYAICVVKLDLQAKTPEVSLLQLIKSTT